jgi:hypothetical protein
MSFESYLYIILASGLGRHCYCYRLPLGWFIKARTFFHERIDHPCQRQCAKKLTSRNSADSTDLATICIHKDAKSPPPTVKNKWTLRVGRLFTEIAIIKCQYPTTVGPLQSSAQVVSFTRVSADFKMYIWANRMAVKSSLVGTYPSGRCHNFKKTRLIVNRRQCRHHRRHRHRLRPRRQM